MDEGIKFFVGLDAHKDSVAIAACDVGREPSRSETPSSPTCKGWSMLREYGPARQVSLVYETGPISDGLHQS